MLAIVLTLAAGMGTAGCGGAGDRDVRHVPPAQTGITSIVAALRSDDPAQAYALLAESIRAQMGFEEFAAQWQASAAERQDRAQALETELAGSPAAGERARITYPDGKSVHLVREGDGWRIESALVSLAHAGRPRDAALLLARALTARDYDAVMRILTNSRRERIGQQLEDFTTSLTRHLEAGPDTLERIDDGRAELRWDDGDAHYRIALHKEGDQWRVDDVHLPPAAATTDATRSPQD